MPTLDWIGKNKVVNHHLDVPYRVLKKQYEYGETVKSNENMIIHGDNLEALKALLPQYENRVQCIYIDPPYNTGNEKWVYNDNVNDPRIKKWLGEVVGKEGEDLSRHDKWLCMMYPRLRLLQKLLSDDGVIFISIDDNEQANLKLICDEIFGAANMIAECVVQSNSAKNNANFFSITHEYMMVYAKKIDALPKDWKVKKLNADEFRKRCRQLMKSNLSQEEIHKELLTLTKYPRFFDFDHYTYADEKGPFRASDLTAPNSNNYYDIIHPQTQKPCKTGTRGWAYSQEQMNEFIEEDKVLFGKDESIMPQFKNHFDENETSRPKSVLFFDTQATTKWIKSNGFHFAFPKPVSLMEYIMQMYPDKNAIVLDSFAGSGTTAHAVLNSNKADGGNRKFILIEMMDYADHITAERVKRVIDGSGEGKKTPEGTGGGFSYYELGEPLLKDGVINEAIEIDDLRRYIYFTETKQPLGVLKADEPCYLGLHIGTAYYFYYERGCITTLNRDFLHTIQTKAERYVIYADLCTFSERELEQYRITFKKIPRDIMKL